jgi:hypothetical protein
MEDPLPGRERGVVGLPDGKVGVRSTSARASVHAVRIEAEEGGDDEEKRSDAEP